MNPVIKITPANDIHVKSLKFSAVNEENRVVGSLPENSILLVVPQTRENIKELTVGEIHNFLFLTHQNPTESDLVELYTNSVIHSMTYNMSDFFETFRVYLVGERK